MKKVIFLAVFLLSVFSASAQFDMGIKFGYGSSLGLNNITQVATGEYDLNAVNADLSNNFQGGVFARISFDKVYVQPEVLYAIGVNNYTITFQDATSGQVTYDKFVTVSTVDVPLLIGYKVLDLKVFNLRVFAGPKLRLNAGSSLEFDNVTSSNNNFDTNRLTKDLKSSQVGLEAGFGVDFLKFTLDARYNLIGNMYETKIADVDIKNLPASTFVISLGWKLI